MKQNQQGWRAFMSPLSEDNNKLDQNDHTQIQSKQGDISSFTLSSKQTPQNINLQETNGAHFLFNALNQASQGQQQQLSILESQINGPAGMSNNGILADISSKVIELKKRMFTNLNNGPQDEVSKDDGAYQEIMQNQNIQTGSVCNKKDSNILEKQLTPSSVFIESPDQHTLYRQFYQKHIQQPIQNNCNIVENNNNNINNANYSSVPSNLIPTIQYSTPGNDQFNNYHSTLGQQLSPGHLGFHIGSDPIDSNHQMQGLLLSDRSPTSPGFSETQRSKHQRISILPHEYMHHSTTRSMSNKVCSSLAKKSSFLEDLESAQKKDPNKHNINGDYEVSPMSNLYRPADEDNETAMLRRCMEKISAKLDKEKQKRKELEKIVRISNKSIDCLKNDISNYSLDIQLVKQLTLNTTRAVESRSNSSAVRGSNIGPSALSTVTATTIKAPNKSKEKPFHQASTATKAKSIGVMCRRQSKSVSGMTREIENSLRGIKTNRVLAEEAHWNDEDYYDDDSVTAKTPKGYINTSGNNHNTLLQPFQTQIFAQPQQQQQQQQNIIQSQLLSGRRMNRNDNLNINNSEILEKMQQAKAAKAKMFLEKMDGKSSNKMKKQSSHKKAVQSQITTMTTTSAKRRGQQESNVSNSSCYASVSSSEKQLNNQSGKTSKPRRRSSANKQQNHHSNIDNYSSSKSMHSQQIESFNSIANNHNNNNIYKGNSNLITQQGISQPYMNIQPTCVQQGQQDCQQSQSSGRLQISGESSEYERQELMRLKLDAFKKVKSRLSSEFEELKRQFISEGGATVAAVGGNGNKETTDDTSSNSAVVSAAFSNIKGGGQNQIAGNNNNTLISNRPIENGMDSLLNSKDIIGVVKQRAGNGNQNNQEGGNSCSVITKQEEGKIQLGKEEQKQSDQKQQQQMMLQQTKQSKQINDQKQAESEMQQLQSAREQLQQQQQQEHQQQQTQQKCNLFSNELSNHFKNIQETQLQQQNQQRQLQLGQQQLAGRIPNNTFQAEIEQTIISKGNAIQKVANNSIDQQSSNANPVKGALMQPTQQLHFMNIIRNQSKLETQSLGTKQQQQYDDRVQPSKGQEQLDKQITSQQKQQQQSNQKPQSIAVAGQSTAIQINTQPIQQSSSSSSTSGIQHFKNTQIIQHLQQQQQQQPNKGVALQQQQIYRQQFFQTDSTQLQQQQQQPSESSHLRSNPQAGNTSTQSYPQNTTQGIDQFRKQLFPEGVDISDEDGSQILANIKQNPSKIVSNNNTITGVGLNHTNQSTQMKSPQTNNQLLLNASKTNINNNNNNSNKYNRLELNNSVENDSLRGIGVSLERYSKTSKVATAISPRNNNNSTIEQYSTTDSRSSAAVMPVDLFLSNAKQQQQQLSQQQFLKNNNTKTPQNLTQQQSRQLQLPLPLTNLNVLLSGLNQQNSSTSQSSNHSQVVVNQPRYIDNTNELISRQIKKNQMNDSAKQIQQSQQQQSQQQQQQQKQQPQLFYKTPISQNIQGNFNTIQSNNIYQNNNNNSNAIKNPPSSSSSSFSLQQLMQLSKSQDGFGIHPSTSRSDNNTNNPLLSPTFPPKSPVQTTLPIENTPTSNKILNNVDKPQVKSNGNSNNNNNYYSQQQESPQPQTGGASSSSAQLGNMANLQGSTSLLQDTSLAYTASLGTTPAKSNMLSTPINHNLANSNSAANSVNFFLTNTSSSSNHNNNTNPININQTNDQQVQQSLTENNNNINNMYFPTHSL